MSASAARRSAILEWYRREQRDLPWRRTSDPYRILVSEVMLQQTQVVRVVDRYLRFLGRFPDERHLADAATAEVLEEWSGLGYNRRALNLQRAAVHVTTHGWPTKPAGLEELPGVGPYTAAALAALCFGVDVPAVDTNLKRVLSRWLGRPLTGQGLAEAAAAELGDASAGEWNQALMDLGASHCAPRRPACGDCPVVEWCADPTIYEPPPRQGRFAGSSREARGAVVRVLVTAGEAGIDVLASTTGIERDRVIRAVDGLAADGLLEAMPQGSYRLAVSPEGRTTSSAT